MQQGKVDFDDERERSFTRLTVSFSFSNYEGQCREKLKLHVCSYAPKYRPPKAPSDKTLETKTAAVQANGEEVRWVWTSNVVTTSCVTGVAQPLTLVIIWNMSSTWPSRGWSHPFTAPPAPTNQKRCAKQAKTKKKRRSPRASKRQLMVRAKWDEKARFFLSSTPLADRQQQLLKEAVAWLVGVERWFKEEHCKRIIDQPQLSVTYVLPLPHDIYVDYYLVANS